MSRTSTSEPRYFLKCQSFVSRRLDAGRADLQRIALGNRVLFIQQVAHRAGKRLGHSSIGHAAVRVLVDKVAQVPARALLFKHDVPQIDADPLGHRAASSAQTAAVLGRLPFGWVNQIPPYTKGKSEVNLTLSQLLLFLQ